MKKELQDEMFEAMLRSALRDHREEELLTEEKLRAQGEEHQFSPEFERKMEKLIKKCGGRNGGRAIRSASTMWPLCLWQSFWQEASWSPRWRPSVRLL